MIIKLQPLQSLEWVMAAKVTEHYDKLSNSDSSGEELLMIYNSAKQKFAGKVHHIFIADQPEEFYRGLAAGRVLENRYGSVNVNMEDITRKRQLSLFS